MSRTALRYFGGKSALAPWIVSLLPEHGAYLEPFGGGASVLLAKPPALRETYNDLDGAVVAFFRCLRDEPEALVRAIDLTPFARAEADAADVDESNISDLERARRLYVRSGQTIHGAPSRGRMGWRCDTRVTGNGTNIEMWNRTAHLWQIACRLKTVQIERSDALTCISRFDRSECLHFVDPPYVAETRGDRWAKAAYAVEMSTEDHRALAETLHAVKGMVVLCGYSSPLYDDLYRGWVRLEHQARQQSRGTATEVLWLNDAAASAHRQSPLSLEVVA